MAQTAAHLVDHVIPPVPVRQWVISVPKRLRGFLADEARANPRGNLDWHAIGPRLLPRLTARGLDGACNVLRKPNRARGEETAPSGSVWSALMRSARRMMDAKSRFFREK